MVPKAVLWLIEVLLASVSLYLAALVYHRLAQGSSAAALPFVADYAAVSLVWAAVLSVPYFYTRGFDKRSGLLSHIRETLKFDLIAILGFAAWLFFFHPALPRLLFLLFCLGDAFLLVNFHVLVWSKVRWEED